MFSSLRVTQLPTSSEFNDSDLFLVADQVNENSKAVRFDALNNALSIDRLIGYDTITTELNDTVDSVSALTGTFSDGQFRSLADLHNLILNNETLETNRYDSVSTKLDDLDGRLSNELLSNASNIANFVNILEQMEEREFLAGLASGFLYATNVTVGEV